MVASRNIFILPFVLFILYMCWTLVPVFLLFILLLLSYYFLLLSLSFSSLSLKFIFLYFIHVFVLFMLRSFSSHLVITADFLLIAITMIHIIDVVPHWRSISSRMTCLFSFSYRKKKKTLQRKAKNVFFFHHSKTKSGLGTENFDGLEIDD